MAFIRLVNVHLTGVVYFFVLAAEVFTVAFDFTDGVQCLHSLSVGRLNVLGQNFGRKLIVDDFHRVAHYIVLLGQRAERC